MGLSLPLYFFGSFNPIFALVIGYSGRDKSLMSAIKKAYSESGSGMLFWCGYGHKINEYVKELLEYLQSNGRKGFYIPTEGFDPTMIHIAKICYENDSKFHTEIDRQLHNIDNNTNNKSPFKLEITEENALLRSNLLPILLPTDIFLVEAVFPENTKVWQTINDITKNKSLCVVPHKGCIYSFGVMNEIKDSFNNYIRGDIRRTPITYKEIKENTVFKNLYLATIVKSLSEVLKLQNNGRNRIWNDEYYNKTIGNVTYKVYNAVEIALFFDDKIYSANPYAYLSINPTFQIIHNGEVPKSVKFEIGKNYHENLLQIKPNVKFHDQIQKWINIFFPTANKLQFEYPINSGTGFKFTISSDTMYVSLMKNNSTPRYRLSTPPTFARNKIIRSGIQYGEPRLEFFNNQTNTIKLDFHPMRGLRDNKPYDYSFNGNVYDPEINLAIICPAQYNQALNLFLNRLNTKIEAGKNNPDYLLDYPGFLQAYGIPLNIPYQSSDLCRDCILPTNQPTLIQTATNLADSIKKAIDQLDETRKKAVIVIFIPTAWNQFTSLDSEGEKFDLHDYIKAYAAQKQIATQFIQEETLYDTLICQVNWWLSLSFYVKTYRTPWVLQGLQEDTAFVGIGYSVNHKSDKEKVVLGCSHIYNSLGQGLKYKLSKVEDCTFDKQNNPYLSYDDAFKFGVMIRELFLNATGEIPKRVVIHKRTYFKAEEIKGIVDSLSKTGIKQIDLIEINYEPDAKFIAMYSSQSELKPNSFPLSRGTCILMDNYSALLWTHGIVQSVKVETNSYFQGGKGMPIPIKITKHYGTTTINMIANEILGLTKMNWNSFNLYSKLPATIQTSNEIARIGWLLNRFEGKTYDYRNFM